MVFIWEIYGIDKRKLRRSIQCKCMNSSAFNRTHSKWDFVCVVHFRAVLLGIPLGWSMVWRSMFLFNVIMYSWQHYRNKHIAIWKAKETKQTLSLFCNGIIFQLFTRQENLVTTTMPEDNGFWISLGRCILDVSRSLQVIIFRNSDFP